MKKLILRFGFCCLFLCGIFLILSCSIQSSDQTRTTTNSMYKNLKNINRGENLIIHFNINSARKKQQNTAKQNSISDQSIQIKTNNSSISSPKNSHN